MNEKVISNRHFSSPIRSDPMSATIAMTTMTRATTRAISSERARRRSRAMTTNARRMIIRPDALSSSSRSEEIASRGLTLDAFDAKDVERALGELRARDAEDGNALVDAPDWLVTWFLRDRKLEVDKAREKTVKYLEWRARDGFDDLSGVDVDEEAATGKAVLLSERDACGRSVVYVTLTKHEVETRDLSRTCRLCVCLVDEAVERSRAEGEGGVETLMCVFDLRGFTMKNADIDFVKFFIKCIFDYFPKRVSQVLIVDAPWVFKPVWAVIKPLMGKYASLVRQVKVSEAKEYFVEGSKVFE